MGKKILTIIVMSILLSIVLYPSTNSAEASSATYKYVKVDSGSKLNMRSKPSTTSTVKKKLSNNSKVQVVSTNKSWSKVKHGSTTGYVNNTYIATKQSTSTTTSKSNAIVSKAKTLLGKPYVYGASGPNSFDCSGFVYYVLNQSGVKVSRMSTASHWSAIKKVSSPQPGDILFLKNTYKSGPSHMGIYIGNNQYIHASSSSTGVKIDSVNSSYTQKHFLGYGRYS